MILILMEEMDVVIDDIDYVEDREKCRLKWENKWMDRKKKKNIKLYKM